MIDYSNIKDYIRRKLGDGIVDVELTSEQMDDAIVETLDFFKMMMGQTKTASFVLSNRGEYDGSEIADDVDYVVDMIFTNIASGGLEDAFEWADVKVSADELMSNGGYASYVQWLQYRESTYQIMSADREWEWDRTRRKLIVSPTPTSAEKVAVLYSSTEFDPSFLVGYEEKLFKDYALAQAMKTLGNIRTKFSDMPSANGSFTLNGDTMFANATDLENKVEEKLKQLTEPLGFWLR